MSTELRPQEGPLNNGLPKTVTRRPRPRTSRWSLYALIAPATVLGRNLTVACVLAWRKDLGVDVELVVQQDMAFLTLGAGCAVLGLLRPAYRSELAWFALVLSILVPLLSTCLAAINARAS
jgi:hypothetical protein